MTYMTRMGNRDMTGDMAQAQLPVVYAEQDGVLYNEMHGYVEDMDGASMRDSVIGVSEDHKWDWHWKNTMHRSNRCPTK